MSHMLTDMHAAGDNDEAGHMSHPSTDGCRLFG
jgi:hypothetical protein